MTTSYIIHIGTIGGGLATTQDRGQTWHLDALPADCNVRTLASYAGNPQRLLAGTSRGAAGGRAALRPLAAGAAAVGGASVDLEQHLHFRPWGLRRQSIRTEIRA